MENEMRTRPHERLALSNGRIILPQKIVTGKVLVIEDERILAVDDPGSIGEGVEVLDVGGRIISPGLIDIHTHGAVGRSFNQADPEAIAEITEINARYGVTALLATISTAPLADMLASLETACQWMDGAQAGAHVIGIHIEGPYFSLGQIGAQDPNNVRTPDDGSVEQLLAHPEKLRIVTFAPELPGALELTARLARLGIVAAAGHSSAREEHILAAIQAGLSHAIHIWSGQSSTVREGPWRKPGLLESTLVFDELTTEMISDNKHLPPTLMKLAYKCKGPDRLCVISDATNGAGLPDGVRFGMGEVAYEVVDGVAMTMDRLSFAGSTTLAGQMIPILVHQAAIPLVDAVRMASLTPAKVIGVADRKGSLEPGKDADISIFNEDFSAWRTMVKGRWVHISTQ